MQAQSPSRIIAPDQAGLERAVQCLRGGGLVAVPTETVYGLAARADSAHAVAAIYRAKGRPDFNPLIVHVPSRERAEAVARFSDPARRLAAAFWPGPLTMVLPLRDGAQIAPAVTAGLASVALRCPAHPVMRRVLEDSGLALAAPSANRSGGISPTRAEHVVASLGERVDWVLDGGACAAGIESTIVAVDDRGGWRILRPGPVSIAQIQSVVGSAPAAVTPDRGIEAPGQLASHYAPGKPVRLNAGQAEADEFHIGFADIAGDFNMSPDGDMEQAAAQLYEALHRAAAAPPPRIAVAPVPDRDIGIAINDRLRRAAA